MKEPKRRKPHERYIQYVFHFQCPRDSIDIRKITKEELDYVLSTYCLFKQCHDFKSCKKLLEVHYPELII